MALVHVLTFISFKHDTLIYAIHVENSKLRMQVNQGVLWYCSAGRAPQFAVNELQTFYYPPPEGSQRVRVCRRHLIRLKLFPETKQLESFRHGNAPTVAKAPYG